MTTEPTRVMLLDGGSDALLGITFHLHLSGFAADIFKDAHDALNWVRNCPVGNYLCLIVNTLDERFAAESLEKTLLRPTFPLPVLFITGNTGAKRPPRNDDSSAEIRCCTPETLMQHLRLMKTETAVTAEAYCPQEYRDV
ncbi:hypothetical protein DSOUD_1054 [Desulfuromonas soudanensis]|uniref:Response regulatory domain-containing protein n=1 Tax=Desulfuromonas soudanensis TaxID=1603606 RepID=A0A0M3QF97_9BACT|nr:hypothetical protein [Desulfuromonas soudanensis]ALC15839.1 hypothetical protein DSOUD_1054 [Desulfuromonas soudanensis]